MMYCYDYRTHKNPSTFLISCTITEDTEILKQKKQAECLDAFNLFDLLNVFGAESCWTRVSC